MSDLPLVQRLHSRRMSTAGALAGVLLTGLLLGAVFIAGRAHAPDFSVIAAAAPAVRIHLGAVLAALAAGAVLMAGPKGRTMHRVLGWTWSLFMLTAAAASLMIRAEGAFALLYFLSIFVLIIVPRAILKARRHEVPSHAKSMTGVFVGGLLFAGTFAFLPGRLLWTVFLG